MSLTFTPRASVHFWSATRVLCPLPHSLFYGNVWETTTKRSSRRIFITRHLRGRTLWTHRLQHEREEGLRCLLQHHTIWCEWDIEKNQPPLQLSQRAAIRSQNYEIVSELITVSGTRRWRHQRCVQKEAFSNTGELRKTQVETTWQFNDMSGIWMYVVCYMVNRCSFSTPLALMFRWHSC